MAKSRRNLLTEADGRALAAAMLRGFSKSIECENFQWSIEAMYRVEGRQQDNVLLRYFTKIQAGNADVLSGFCAVLTDYIGFCEDGVVLDKDYYEKLTERKITGTPGPWPTMDNEEKEERAAFQGFMSRATGDSAGTGDPGAA